MVNAACFFIISAIIFTLSGCGTMASGKEWGEDAPLLPGWSKVGRAAYNAAVSPLTWGPAIGAAVFQIGNWDKKVSKWASDKTPVFGSQNNADSWAYARQRNWS